MRAIAKRIDKKKMALAYARIMELFTADDDGKLKTPGANT